MIGLAHVGNIGSFILRAKDRLVIVEDTALVGRGKMLVAGTEGNLVVVFGLGDVGGQILQFGRHDETGFGQGLHGAVLRGEDKIGRASCRERV